MTKLLDEAIMLVRSLPDARQDELAARIIAELAGDEEDDEFDRTIAATADRLDRLIDEALAEDDAGLTRDWPLRAQ
jgi:hypothetical protein